MQLAEIEARMKAYYDGLTEANAKKRQRGANSASQRSPVFQNLEDGQCGRMSIRRMLSG